MNIPLKEFGFYETEEDFWNEPDHKKWLDGYIKFNGIGESELEDLLIDHDLIITFLDQREGLYHVEFNNSAGFITLYESTELKDHYKIKEENLKYKFIFDKIKEML